MLTKFLLDCQDHSLSDFAATFQTVFRCKLSHFKEK